jgi:methionyl aminopeptidase
MIIVKIPAELETMRVSGRIAANVRDQICSLVSPGTTTAELDAHAARLIAENKAESAFLGYRGYPGNICISVNEEVVHGIPGQRRIELGDIVSIDVGIRHEGYIGDTAATVMVGVSTLEVVNLVDATRDALEAGIDAARAGNRLSDISHAIESVAVAAGFSVVREFVGHGVGADLHEDPQIPNFGQPGRGPKLRPGMTFALEPMVNMGLAGVRTTDNGWTVVATDGLPSAHFEHTVAIRAAGPAEILT